MGESRNRQRKREEYDFIIIDTDSVFDEEKARLLGEADKVVVVTRQDEGLCLCDRDACVQHQRREQ